MAARKLGGVPRNGEEARLLRAIAEELRRPDEAETPGDAPILYMEESGTPDNYAHWYAVWDAFAGVDDETRSRALLGAIREVLGPKEALRVVTASGLTPKEAVGMGFNEYAEERGQSVQA